MTIKLLALWSTPSDVDGFESEYMSGHIPLVAKVPGLTGAVASKAIDGPYYRIAEMLFESAEALGGAIGSEEGQAVLADANRLQETYGAKLDVVVAEEEARL